MTTDVVLDSSCWIAWFDQQDARSDVLDACIERYDGRVAVPSMVLFEVDRWMRRNDIDESGREHVLARIGRERALPMDHRCALRAAVLSRQHRLATADAMIAAAASLHDCDLVTFDPDFADVPGATVLAT